MSTMQRTISSLSILLSLAGAVAGCGEGDSGPVNGGPKMLVHGRVDANLNESATTVEAHVIAEDGTREPVAMEPTATDGSGRYRLESSVELSAGTHIVVEATDGSARAAVVLVVEADGDMTAEPMNDETTLEGAVFEELRASTTCEDCSHAAIRGAIEAEGAATFASSEQSSATLADVSAAIEARIDAEATSLRDASRTAFDAYVTARADAQANEVAALDGATSTSAMASAHADYDQAIVEGN